MQVGLIRRQGLQLADSALEVSIRLRRLELRGGNGPVFRCNHLRELCDQGVRVLRELLVVCLGLVLASRLLRLKCFGVTDDLLKQPHHRGGTCVCLVLGELHWRCLRAALEVDHLLADAFGVEVLEPKQGFLQDGLGGPLVGYNRLELGVLCLAVLAGLLDLDLRGHDLRLGLRNLLLQLGHESSERVELRLEVALVLVLAICCLLILVKLFVAVCFEFCLFFLLFLELCHHRVHHPLHLGERVQLCRQGQGRKLGPRAACRTNGRGAPAAVPSLKEVIGLEGGLCRCTPQRLHGVHAAGRSGGACTRSRAGPLLQQAHALGQHLPVVILREDCNGLGHGLQLLVAHCAPALPVLVQIHTSDLQLAQDLHVCRALLPGEVQVLLGVR
mmetsp:Transcript_133036/g.370870  ORF Transcript_133036/g.370870 Transcript_133036/m.370870 type:complete len:387 (+) Transcript_133036:191-1351(+)